MAAKADACTTSEVGSVAAPVEELQRQVDEMEEEAEQLKNLIDSVEAPAGMTDCGEVDKRSVYVGSVDYGSTPEELLQHFKSSGQTNRITIIVDKFTGDPKGFAYIEFADEQSMERSLLLDGSLFRGRQLKVNKKRTNIPGFKGKGKGKAKYHFKGKGKGYQNFHDLWYGSYEYMPSRPSFKGAVKYMPY